MSGAVSLTLLTSVVTSSPNTTITVTSSYSTTSASASCVTATLRTYDYISSDACNAKWSYNVSFAATVLSRVSSELLL